MKKLLISIFALLFIAGNVLAQSNKNKKTEDFKLTYTMSPSDLFFSELKQSFELKKGKKSLVFIPSIIYRSNSYESTMGFTGELQYRLYINHEQFTEDVFKGRIYLAPFGKFTYAKNTDNWTEAQDIITEVTAWEAGNLLGWQKIFQNKLTIDFGIGGSIRFADEKTDFDAYKTYAFNEQFWGLGFQGIKPKIQASIGYAF